MTCVSPEARITPGCTGMYAPEHEAAWRRIVDFVHAHGQAKICLQLGHSGSKGSTRIGWEGYDVPLEDGNWPLIAASDVPWSPANQIPRPMTRADMDAVRDQFVAAVKMGEAAGFDMIELHAAHGYLLSSFITPLHNKRSDDYGGSLENRLRFPLEVFAAMRAAWPADKPMSVRISANDWMGDLGVTPDEAVEIARAFADAGADLIDVSAGQTWAESNPVYGRMFQTPFADQIRNEARVSTMAVGNIYETDHVNSILAAGRADLVALARPHLIDPMWTLRAAAAQDYRKRRGAAALSRRHGAARAQPRARGGDEGMTRSQASMLSSPAAAPASARRSRGRWRSEGAKVTLVGRRKDKLEEVARANPGAAIAVADVTERDRRRRRARRSRAPRTARSRSWSTMPAPRPARRSRKLDAERLAGDDGGQSRRGAFTAARRLCPICSPRRAAASSRSRRSPGCTASPTPRPMSPPSMARSG